MTCRRDRRRRRPDLAPVLRGSRLRAIKAALRARDGHECFYCLCVLLDAGTIEHLHRWADGGSSQPANLVLAHSDCNFATRHLTVDQKMLLRGDALLARIAAERASAA
jgi:5-methylcytosine-specific restriction endonuclease McrA